MKEFLLVQVVVIVTGVVLLFLAPPLIYILDPVLRLFIMWVDYWL